MDREKLLEEIKEAQNQILETEPDNEAQTREWIIKPLLDKLGYKRNEIKPESPDPSGKIPDFTIMPNTEFTWYLEAKDYRKDLNDDHATQAINYAHSHSKRWVVLSNGKEWRLYDDWIKGESADRLIIAVKLSDTEAILKFLIAISKDSMLNDKISEYCAYYRIKKYFDENILNPNSKLINRIVNIIKSDIKDLNITINGDYVVRYFEELKNSNNNLETQQSTINVYSDTKSSDFKDYSSSNILKEKGWFSLKDAEKDISIGTSKKPELFKLPNNQEFHVTDWSELLVHYFEYLLNNHESQVSKIIDNFKNIINKEPKNSNGITYRSKETITHKHETYYVNTHSSTQEKINYLIKITKKLDLPLESFQFKLKE